MIIYNIEPNNSESSVSLGLIAKRLKVTNSAIHSVLRNSLKYIAYGYKSDMPNSNCPHLFLPLNSALRLINDAQNGLILKRALTHE